MRDNRIGKIVSTLQHKRIQNESARKTSRISKVIVSLGKSKEQVSWVSESQEDVLNGGWSTLVSLEEHDVFSLWACNIILWFTSGLWSPWSFLMITCLVRDQTGRLMLLMLDFRTWRSLVVVIVVVREVNDRIDNQMEREDLIDHMNTVDDEY